MGFIYKILIMFLMATLAQTMTASEIYKSNSHSVTFVVSTNERNVKLLLLNKNVAEGSGVAVADDVIATSCTLVLAGKYIFVGLSDDYRAEIIAINKKDDICLIKIPIKVFTPVDLGKFGSLKVGEEIYTISSTDAGKCISRGIISSVSKFKSGTVLLTDAITSHGSLGGGIFNQNGELIGIIRYTPNDKYKFTAGTPADWIAEKLNK